MHFHYYKKLFTILLYLFIAMCFTAFLIFLRESSLGIPVLNYHQVNDQDKNFLTLSTSEFRQQMTYLKKQGYHTISPVELTDFLTKGTPLPSKPILITFDDGYRDNYTEAFPILRECDFTATIFLVADYINRFDNYLTWEQAIEMNEAGFYMGSHTLSHYALAPLSRDMQIQQIHDSKLAIQWHTLQYANYIAYPCGDYTPAVIETVQNSAYTGGFTVRYDLVHPWDNPYFLNRIPIFGNNGTYSFEKFLLRLYGAPLFGRMERLRHKLINYGWPNLARLIPLP